MSELLSFYFGLWLGMIIASLYFLMSKHKEKKEDE